jgi:hypothetical protein
MSEGPRSFTSSIRVGEDGSRHRVSGLQMKFIFLELKTDQVAAVPLCCSSDSWDTRSTVQTRLFQPWLELDLAQELLRITRIVPWQHAKRVFV